MPEPYTAAPAVRLSDIDRNGYVNHPVYAAYLGETRAAYYRDVIGLDMNRLDTVIVSLSIEFHEPVEYGDDVTIYCTVTDVGRSSITMQYDLYVDENTAATGETVQVLTDGEGTSRRISDAWRSAIDVHEAGTIATE